MILFFYFSLIFIFLAILIYFIYFIHIVAMSICGLPSDQQMRQSLIKIVTHYIGQRRHFIDLGCGQGHVCLAIKKEFSQLTVIGLEKSFWQLLFARFKTKLLKQKIRFNKTNFLKYDLSKTEIIYMYLRPPILKKLEQKLIDELPSGAILISNTFCLPYRQPQEIITTQQVKFNKQVKFFIYLF